MSGEDLQRQTSINIQEKANLIDRFEIIYIYIYYTQLIN